MARLRFSLGLVMTGMALALAGCPTSTTPSNVPIDQLGATYGSATCQVVRECYGDAVVALFTGTSGIAACEARAEAAYTNGALPRYQAAIAMGTLTYDGTQAGPCVDALQGLGCAAVSSRPPAACDALFVGHVAAGGACALDEECIGDAFCSVTTACPGTCQALGGTGTACTRDQACQSGLRCTGGHCMAPAGEGAACQGSTGVDCGGGLICRGGSTTTAGVCATTASVFAAGSGQACNPQNGQLCLAGLSCIVASSTSISCGASGVAAGSPCHLALPDMCAIGFYCAGPNLSTMPPQFDGTCTALPTAGMPCAPVAFGESCADGFACDAGTCAQLEDNGGSCMTDMDCYGGQCRSGTCAAPTYCPTP